MDGSREMQWHSGYSFKRTFMNLTTMQALAAINRFNAFLYEKNKLG